LAEDEEGHDGQNDHKQKHSHRGLFALNSEGATTSRCCIIHLRAVVPTVHDARVQAAAVAEAVLLQAAVGEAEAEP
jgi:hypothetical protein